MKRVTITIYVSFRDYVETHTPTISWVELSKWLDDNCPGWSGAIYVLPDGRQGHINNFGA
jgi:hypothetical protein